MFMCKHLFVVLCLMGFIVSGCSHSENDWFFEGDNVYLSADVTTNSLVAYESMDLSTLIKTEQSNISVYKVLNMQNGSVYKLVIEPVEDRDGYLGAGRLNLYFYVTMEKIYRIWSYVYEDNILKEFYDDDQQLIQVLDTDEKIINNSYLVCQQEELPDLLEEGGVGMHNCIEIKDTQIESRMWNVTDNGETYFYESFSWELGKGLIAYRSGFRAERDILYLNNISIVSKNE
jgi:hypothetical protein